MHQREQKRPVFTQFWRSKEGAIDKVSATLMRTVKVTIYIIPERIARSPSTVTADLETQLSKTTSMVSLPMASSVLLMVDHHDNRMESIHEVSAISVTR